MTSTQAAKVAEMEDTHEAIVDKAIWSTAQRIMDERTRNHRTVRNEYAFTGMIECGCCGKHYMHKVNHSGHKWSSDFWACITYLAEGTKACSNSRIKDMALKNAFVSAYNEFIKHRPQGESIVAIQEIIEDLRGQERELAELHMSRLIAQKAYEAERKKIKERIATMNERIAELRISRVPESEHVPINEFQENKVRRFLTKVIVKQFTVTFVFYNGAEISRDYDNGRSGNKTGWKSKRKDA